MMKINSSTSTTNQNSSGNEAKSNYVFTNLSKFFTKFS